ncbi:MAG: tRNA pseudouridine(38-40) synthase TruA [Gemmatimonadales bacterium]
MERTFLLVLEFDGTGFCGWQRQAEGRSVQAVVEQALSRLAGRNTKVIGAGRTDAGVHALGMPVSAAMPTRWEPETLLRAANSVLPRDVAVREIREVVSGTDARRAALSRHYRFDIGTDGGGRSPFRARTEWALGRPVDVEAMTRTAALLPGEHDFRAFAIVGEPKPHYRCRVLEACWTPLDATRHRFTIAADRFLHHMVRMLVGTMVDIGLGRRPESDMARLLTLPHNAETSAPAPAAGLSFVEATYPNSIFLTERASW